VNERPNQRTSDRDDNIPAITQNPFHILSLILILSLSLSLSRLTLKTRQAEKVIFFLNASNWTARLCGHSRLQYRVSGTVHHLHTNTYTQYLSHTHSHTLSHTHSHTHTLTHSLTHTHSRHQSASKFAYRYRTIHQL